MSSDAKRKPQDAPGDQPSDRKKAKEDDTNTAIDSQEEVLKVVASDELILLDARRDDEILEAGFLKSSQPGHRWVHVSCKREEAPLLEATASYMIPDKNTPIITYCRSGARSGRAKSILLSQGYQTVVNAGGYGDLGWLQKLIAPAKEEEEQKE